MLEFAKMHGIGNDYIYLDGFRQDLPDSASTLGQWSRVLSDRHFGVGGDGIILILPSDKQDFRMRMFNADGSEGKMCGNGIRCLAKYVWDTGLTDRTQLTVETLAGTIGIELIVEDETAVGARVDMGVPGLTRGSLPMTGHAAEAASSIPFEVPGGVRLSGTGVSMGNSHVIFFVDAADEVPLTEWGPLIEHDPRFPERTNVEFVQVIQPGKLRMRVWERGSGVTMACGTGACASVVASHTTLQLPRRSSVVLDGGTLSIYWDEGSQHVFMIGPAELAFSGSCDLRALLDRVPNP